MKKIWICTLLALLILAGLFSWAAYEHTTWDEDFTTEDRQHGTAHFAYLEWRYWGHPHLISFGGGTISCAGTFRLGKHQSHWKSTRDERIFALQFSQQRWYAVSLDRTDMSKEVVIRFYSAKDGEMLQEIAPQEYPLKLAIQNLWLGDENVEVLSAFPKDDYWTQSSLLAQTWWKIAHAEDVKEVDQVFIEKIIAQEFPGRVSFLPPQPAK